MQIKTDGDTSTSMIINVLYFASLADAAGRSEERVCVPSQTSLTDLYAQLSQQHRFEHPYTDLRVAVNDYFVAWSDPITDGDQVVFITPVAGG